MIPEVIHATHLHEYTLSLCFGDGVQGEIDFSDELYGEIFEPLKDVDFFKQFLVHPELHTLIWPNGADFSPEYLYSKVQISV
jgi:hypothetical protein